MIAECSTRTTKASIQSRNQINQSIKHTPKQTNQSVPRWPVLALVILPLLLRQHAYILTNDLVARGALARWRKVMKQQRVVGGNSALWYRVPSDLLAYRGLIPLAATSTTLTLHALVSSCIDPSRHPDLCNNTSVLSPKVMFLHHQCLLFLLPPSFITSSLTCTVKERERDGSL